MRVVRGLWWALFLLALAGAATLTGVRLAEPRSGLGVQLMSFAPVGLGLWAIVAALVLIRLVIGPHRIRWLMVAVMVVVPLGLHAWWLHDLYVGPQPPPDPSATSVRVLAVNARLGSADGPDLVSTTVARDVDLLVVSEITPGLLRTMEQAGIDTALPFRAGEAATGSAGTMVFATWELTDVASVPTSFGSYRVTLAAPDGPLRLVAAHPHPPTGDIAGWRADLEAVRTAAQDADLVVGDLNSTPDHPEYRAILDAAPGGLDDAVEVANDGWRPTWPAGDRRMYGLPMPLLVQIDHVLVGRRFGVVGTNRIDIPDSDHAGVLAEVALR